MGDGAGGAEDHTGDAAKEREKCREQRDAAQRAQAHAEPAAQVTAELDTLQRGSWLSSSSREHV